MTERYFDVNIYQIHKDYYNYFDFTPSLNNYIGIRLLYTFEQICDLTESYNIGILDMTTKQMSYEHKKFLKKLRKHTYDCSLLITDDKYPDYVMIPDDICIEHKKSIFDSRTYIEKIFLSETKINEYERQYNELYDKCVMYYSNQIDKFNKKYDEHIYRCIIVDNDNDDVDYDDIYNYQEIEQKIDLIYNLMIKNSYISMTIKLNSVEKNNICDVDFKGTIETWNFKRRDGEFNREFDMGGDITLTTSPFNRLNKNDILNIFVNDTDIYFKDKNNIVILIREDIYKKKFTEWIYEYLN